MPISTNPPISLSLVSTDSFYLFFTRCAAALTGSSVPGLHLQHRAEKLLGGLCEEADLSVGMKAVQVG